MTLNSYFFLKNEKNIILLAFILLHFFAPQLDFLGMKYQTSHRDFLF